MCGKDLDIEEGIHFQWHLAARGRGDVHIHLVDGHGNRLQRAEVVEANSTEPPIWQMCGHAPAFHLPGAVREFGTTFHWGRRQFACSLLCYVD